MTIVSIAIRLGDRIFLFDGPVELVGSWIDAIATIAGDDRMLLGPNGLVVERLRVERIELPERRRQ